METIITILIFVGVMYAMSKLGLGCCGGHSKNNENNSGESCCGSKKEKTSKDVFKK